MPETVKAEKLYKFGKGKGQVKKEFTTTLDEDKNVIGHDMTKYNRAGQKVKQRGFKAKGAATTAKSPYMMYGKESGVMMSESPLAKTGCSKKYKKGK
jgi:hypothetical protein